MFAGFDDSMVSYDLEVIPEDMEVRGSMDSGDPDFDRKDEDKILAEIEDGNDWSWCRVRVLATYDGVSNIVGMDSLGCVSYASEEEFRAPDGYFDDMRCAARADLYDNIESVLARFGCVDPAREPVWID